MLINDVTKPVAVWGVDTGYDWYWRASDAALIQDVALPALTPTDTLIAIYVANFPGAVYAADNPGIAAYGHRDLIEAQPSVFDTAQARQIAAGRLIERGGPLRKIDAVTHRPGLAVGQNITGHGARAQPGRALPGARCADEPRRDQGRGRDRVLALRGEPGRGRAVLRDVAEVLAACTPNTGSAQSGSGTVGGPIGGGGGDGGGGGGSSAPGPIYIGGERQVWLHADATWRPIPGFVDVLLDAARRGADRHGALSELGAGGRHDDQRAPVDGQRRRGRRRHHDRGHRRHAAGGLPGVRGDGASTPQDYRMEAIVTGTSGEGAVAGVVAYPPGVATRRRG